MSPQFFKIILSPHASKLHIPDEFVIKYGADLRDPVFLEVPTGAIWQVKLHNSNCLNEGWNQFKDYYSIACGYFLLFQYNGNSHFSVFIFDLTASEIQYPSGPNEHKGKDHCNAMTNTSKSNKRKYALNSLTRYPLRSKLEQSKENGSPSYSGKQRPAAPLSCRRVKLEKANSKEDLCWDVTKAKREETNMEKLVKHNLYDEAYKFKGHCNEVPVVDLSTSKLTTTNQQSKKKTATNLDASNCRYPLRSKQLIEGKFENGDVEEHCNEIPVVDSSNNRHHEKKTSASLDRSQCRYPLRSKQLKEVKLETSNVKEDLLYVAQKAKRKKANNLMLEKGDVEDHCKEVPVGDPSASATSRHNGKKTMANLDASHCRYPLRSMQPKEVKLERWEAVGNMHNKMPKNKVVAVSPYCKSQNSGLPASSPCCWPIRVKLEKPDNLFCATEKANRKEMNNVKLDTEGNFNSAAYKGKASEMTILGKKKMLPSEKHNWGIFFNQHFTVSMLPACVSRNFQLDIPVNFFKKYLKDEETIVNLRVSNGRTWQAKLFDIQSNCPKIESSGWRDFVHGNNLKEHDTCVFELIDGIEPVLDVTIFRAKTPVS